MSETRRVDVTPGLAELLTDAIHGSKLQMVKMPCSVPGCVNIKVRFPAPRLAGVDDLCAMAGLCELMQKAQVKFRQIGHTILVPYVWEGVAG